MKTRMILVMLLLFGSKGVTSHSQNLDGIVTADAKLEKITGDMAFTSADAPCWDNSVLLFADNNVESPEKSTTYRIASDGTVNAIRKNNGITTTIKPSGNGTYYCCEFEGRRIVEMDHDGNILRTIADGYEGRGFDGPNDLVVDTKGGIYFSDARFVPEVEVTVNTSAVYYVKPDGSLIKVVDSLLYPNGVALSPDGSILYVLTAHDQDAGKFVYAFDIDQDGTLSNQRKFCELWLTMQNEALALGNEYANFCICEIEDYTATSGAEGCAVDINGNLYIATDQGIGIQIFSSSGDYLGTINLMTSITNCFFGGPDLQTLYVSAQDGLYTIQTKVPGMRIARGN
ncbi:SMP-30/gluconolactonase/LRE family protein [Candidatus Latescibacterota bacterium]